MGIAAPDKSLNNLIVQRRIVMFALAVLATQNCWACYSPPAQQLMSVEQQVMLATDVSVAQVISATPLAGADVEYRFIVQQRLAGQDRNVFTVTGRAGTRYGKATTFDNHTDPAFWKRGGGRVMNDSDCVIHPGFVVGESYLMFLDSPMTWRSVERIEVVNGQVSDGDKWLNYVREGLGRRK